MTGAEIAVVLGASLLGAFVKAVTGMGYPVIAIPLITLVLGIEDAVVIVAAPNLAANLILCWGARAGRAESRDLPLLVGWGALGAVVGTFALVRVPEDPLLLVLAATVAMFVVTFLRSPELRFSPTTTHRWSPVVGGVAGLMQGAVGVSGPVVASWMHGYRLRATAYVFSITTIFGASGAAQLTLLAASGEYTATRAAVSLLAFVPVLAMIPVGTRLRERLDGPAFEHAVLAVIAGSGLALVIQVVA
ncbi:MAG: sulfite exporter TauE/SafE family protein [Acidimicrobiales bacterium]|nr:sulfite exporter TauE/SafE family protein [Acidimicrobiales bacterium]MCB0970497.1 sulfite exporter TauE/SafE family protein [Acidimicrobiales bacterium]